jgi:hypothetical protein
MTGELQPGKTSYESSLRGCFLFAVLMISSLTVLLATRTFAFTIPHGTTALSNCSDAKHQHLDRDAVPGFTPPLTITAVAVQTFYPRLTPAGPSLRGFLLDETLYNRPPPSC